MSEIDYHRKLLGDRVRNRAFHAALQRVIVPGKTSVLDIGAGTGFLSFLASRLGASQCVLVEYSDMLEVAQQLARANRIANLSFIKGHSGELRLDRFDLVVSETLGNFALEEGMLETLVDARRFVSSHGRIMPLGLKQFVAPVLKPRLQKQIDVWPRVGFDLDFIAAREVALNNMYVKSVRPAEIGEARQWDTIDLRPGSRVPSSLRRATLDWRDLRSEVHGFALWWEVELVEGVSISTSPSAPATHWQQIYLPLMQPLTLQRGDALELQLTSDTRPRTGLDVAWKTLHKRGKRTLHAQQQNIARGRV